MTRARLTHRTLRTPVSVCMIAGITALPLCMVACDNTTSSSKSTTTKKTETPEGAKTTTETTEKKVEHGPK